MGWLDKDIPDEFPEQINASYVGIDLECITPGLEYKASVPYFSISVSRGAKIESFKVAFSGPVKKGKGIGRSVLTAGTDLASVESCIVEAINRPSLLQAGILQQTKQYDCKWPERPGAEDPRIKINVYEVTPNRIYRLVSKDYAIAVWRKDLNSNYRITFRKHEGKYRSKKSIVIEAYSSLGSVKTLVLEAIQNSEEKLNF